MTAEYFVDPIQEELHRQIDQQIADPTGKFRVNWTQFQMAITEQAACIHEPEVAKVYLESGMQELRRAMELQFGLESLNKFITKSPPAGAAPTDKRI